MNRVLFEEQLDLFQLWLVFQIDKQQLDETGCLACLTAYTVFLCMETQYKRKIAKFIQEQNDKIYAPQGLLLTDPSERVLRGCTTFDQSSIDSGRK
uniref:Golgin subfamily A member 7 n=1 Tax=Hucho hucho TaxID=62062 RepID=A0A4W5PE58_9TELE